MYAKGTICGLTRGSNKNHIVRAALEAIAFQTNDLITALKADTGLEINSLLADGGASQNKFLMQFQSDISDTEVICSESGEATALGAAFLAGLAVGLWNDTDEIASINISKTSFKPSLNDKNRNALINGWKKAVNASKAFI